MGILIKKEKTVVETAFYSSGSEDYVTSLAV